MRDFNHGRMCYPIRNCLLITSMINKGSCKIKIGSGWVNSIPICLDVWNFLNFARPLSSTIAAFAGQSNCPL